MAAAVELEHVTLGYRDQAVVEELSLSIAQGELVGLLGPNGAGKTTLLRAITGLCKPWRGEVRLLGRPVERMRPAERARLVAVVPQEIETPVPFTVEEVVLIGRTASLSRWGPPSARDRVRAQRAMAYADVVSLRDRPISALSAGERQRALVAMALAQEPRLFLLDEATSHLDLNHRLEILQIIERLNAEKGVTIILISHDLNLTAEYCRRLILLDHGRLAADGPPSEVVTEETLRRVYRCDVRVRTVPGGPLSVSPVRRLARSDRATQRRVHVIAGGGAGEDILRRLRLDEYAVTVGVLNEGDTDAAAAVALEIPTALERPFSPVSVEALARAKTMAQAADALILSGVPFGPANLPNLDLVEEALSAGKRVFLMSGIESRDYTPGGVATRRVQGFLARGAVAWASIPDLFRMLERQEASDSA